MKNVIFAPRSYHVIQNRDLVTSKIESLNLSNMNVTDDSFIALCFALSYLKNIVSVNVSNNFIGDAGGSLGASFLMTLESL